MFATPYRFTKNHHAIHFKWRNFIVGKFYFNKTVQKQIKENRYFKTVGIEIVNHHMRKSQFC